MYTFTMLLHIRYALSFGLLLLAGNASSQDLVSAARIPEPSGNMQEATVPLVKALREAEKKYQITFIYKDDALKNKRVPSMILDAASLETMLLQIHKSTELNIERTGNKLYTVFDIVNASPAAPDQAKPSGSTSASPAAPLLPVKGKVIDATGNPIPFAVINIKGTQKNVLTDIDGNYTIEAGEEDTLVVSFLGYKTETLAVAGRENVDVKLSTSTKITDEVVVVGYGTSSRREVSSSIGSVKGNILASTPVADPAQALQGRVAGVTITQNSGAPGGTGGTSIRIRGITSITGNNNPLIVLDGYPLADQTSDNVLNAISPSEIESIDVLKDAAAASIYGVRGSNGVIVITTKRGKEGKATVSLDMYRGVQNAWNLPKLLGARDYAIINNEGRLASGYSTLPKLDDPDAVQQNYGSGTNWYDQVFRQAAMTNVNLNMAGGTDRARYALSAGYFQQDGIVRRTDFERYNIRFNGDLKVSNKFNVGNSLTLTRTTENAKNTTGSVESLLILASEAPPTVAPKNEDGSYAGGTADVDAFIEPNPVYEIEVPKATNTRYRTIGNIFAEYEIIPGLKVKANLGMDFVFASNHSHRLAIPATGGRVISQTTVGESRDYYTNFLAEYTATYKKTFGNHSFTLLGGYTAQEGTYNQLSAGRNGYLRNDRPTLNGYGQPITTTNQSTNGGTFGVGTKLLSQVARLNYDFLNKYLVMVSLRRDGTSNFAPEHQYAIFPAVSAAWNLSDEDFMQSFSQVSNIKVRASYGQTGNQNVRPFAYIARVNTGVGYALGQSDGYNGGVAGTAITGSPNTDLVWERNQQINLGVDGSILNNRVNISLDLYERKSIDLILDVQVPALSGTYETVPLNTGDMVNRGIDLSISGNVLGDKSPVQWTSSLVLSTFRNKVTSLGLAAPINYNTDRMQGGGTRVEAGQAVNYFYGYKTDGLFKTDEEVAAHAVQTKPAGNANSTNSTSPGDIRFVDINGDGVINASDRTNLGSSVPTFTYGWTNNITWKIFDLSIFFQGSQGNKVMNVVKYYTQSGIGNANYRQDILDRWTGPNSNTSVPRVIQADPNLNNRVSDRFIEDASYLRLKNIRLTVSLPQSVSKALKISKLRIYGSIQNALTFTKYTGFDPEVGGGTDFGYYPQARTNTIGATFDF
ncbi:MAG: SusC/RagA family TonB-linked outer membrane protein [Bacteroidota bacterium]